MKQPNARRDSRSPVGRFVDRLYRQWCPELKLAAYITALATDTTEREAVVYDTHYEPGQMGSIADALDTRSIRMPSGETVTLSSHKKGKQTVTSATFPSERQAGDWDRGSSHITLRIYDTPRVLGHDIRVGYDYMANDGARCAATVKAGPLDDLPSGIAAKLGELAATLDQMPSVGMPSYHEALAD